MQKVLDWLQPPGLAVHKFERLGEQIDCVVIDQQPAVRGRNVRVATPPPPVAADLSGPGEPLPFETAFFRGDYDGQGRQRACPVGTVAIRRWTLEDLKRWPSIEAWMGAGKRPRPEFLNPSVEWHSYAVGKQFVPNWGVRALFNIWNPYVPRSSEFSLVQSWVVGGEGTDMQTIEAGFQKYKDLYGDWQPHFFIFSTQRNYQAGSNCYNSECNFVITAPGTCIGCAVGPTSTPGGTQYQVDLAWSRLPDGNWWLYWFGQPIGYFPRSRFHSRGLADGAGDLEVGGEVSHFDTVDMASGYYPSRGYGWAGYVNNIKGQVPGTWNTYFRPTLGWGVDDQNCWGLANTSDANGVNFLYGGIGLANPNCHRPF